MLDPQIRRDLVKQLERLPIELQRKVLEFAHTLTLSLPKGVPGAQLLQFAGTIDIADIQQMQQAIEAECEREDSSEW